MSIHVCVYICVYVLCSLGICPILVLHAQHINGVHIIHSNPEIAHTISALYLGRISYIHWIDSSHLTSKELTVMFSVHILVVEHYHLYLPLFHFHVNIILSTTEEQEMRQAWKQAKPFCSSFSSTLFRLSPD